MSHPINPRYLGAGKRAADQMMAAAFPPMTQPPPTPPLTGPTDVPPDIPAIATLEPGQRLMLVLKRTISDQEAKRLLKVMKERYPDVEFGILTGVDGVVILPPSDEAADQ